VVKKKTILKIKKEELTNDIYVMHFEHYDSKKETLTRIGYRGLLQALIVFGATHECLEIYCNEPKIRLRLLCDGYLVKKDDGNGI